MFLISGESQALWNAWLDNVKKQKQKVGELIALLIYSRASDRISPWEPQGGQGLRLQGSLQYILPTENIEERNKVCKKKGLWRSLAWGPPFASLKCSPSSSFKSLDLSHSPPSRRLLPFLRQHPGLHPPFSKVLPQMPRCGPSTHLCPFSPLLTPWLHLHAQHPHPRSL